MRKPPAFLFLLALGLSVQATPPVINALDRTRLDLNGKWAAIIDPYDTGYLDYRAMPYDQAEHPTGGYFLDRKPESESELIEYSFDGADTLYVPRDWNSQREKLFLYEGSVWYRRRFDQPAGELGRRLFLHFGGANYETDVYLNGRKLGRHVGGFTPFTFEVTKLLREKNNSLVVRVNNQRRREAVPTLNTDWWNYGGLTRDVRLVEVPETYIADYSIQLARGTGDRAQVHIQLDGPRLQQSVHVVLPELGIDQTLTTDKTGTAQAEIPLSGLERWSPQHPRLYAVKLVAETDSTTDRIGFRTIETRGAEILLNGKPLFLRGICIHEENPLRGGRATTPEDARLLLGWAKELNCNFARLAHYPHNEYMAKLADEMGILLWEEIPVYWTIQWENADTLANARQQLTELIGRDHNRASVIVWSVANETPVSEPRTRFLRTLVDHARSLDSTRLVSAAMEVRRDPSDPDLRIVDDPFGEYTDLISFNQYVGWYDRLPDYCQKVKWSISRTKPVVVSEFGADALAGRHGGVQARFTEEYQADLYQQTIAMLQRIPGFTGMTPWILTDFRSPRRPLPGIQDGWNRKGVIGETGTKKQAFYVLKAFYDQVEKR